MLGNTANGLFWTYRLLERAEKVMLRRLHRALMLSNAANAVGNNISEIKFT